MNKINKGILIGAISLLIPVVFFGKAIAAVSSYKAHEFSQYCASNPTTCQKAVFENARSGSISCPMANQKVSKVYVHAGDDQDVYELPDSGFSFNLTNNDSTANVFVTTHPHDISWIGVVCSFSSSPTPTCTLTPTPTSSITPTPTRGCPTPTSTPTVTPTATPTPTESPTPTPTPIETVTPTPTIETTGTPTATPSLAPTATPTEAQQENNNDSGSGGTSTTAQTTNQGEVLGANTLAATGNMHQNIANILLAIGSFFLSLPIFDGIKKTTKKVSQKA